MQARTAILSALIAGPAIGLLMGIAADPTMIPSPEPTWRKMRPDPIYADSRSFAESAPQDLSPTWWTDRLPTWKRRALEAEWRRLTYEPEPLPALDPEPEPERPAEPAPKLASAEDEASAGDDAAAAAQGLEPADARPALADSDADAAAGEAAPQTASLPSTPGVPGDL